MKKNFQERAFSAGAAIALLLTCAPELPENRGALAYVGRTPLTRLDADAFKFVRLYQPGEQDSFWLGRNGLEWELIAVEAIYQKIHRRPTYEGMRKGREWEWKKRIYLSRAFEKQVLQGNLGYSDAEVRNYYDTHTKDFRTITYSRDMKPCATDVIPPFDSVRGNVARELFLSGYRHDSGTQNLNDPRLFARFRERMYRDYFLKRYYLEKYGKPMPDSIPALCGKGAVIDTVDLNTVLSLMAPADREEHLKDKEFIIRRTAQWKLFSEKAVSSGYDSMPDVAAVIAWAWKNEVARKYAEEVLVPKAEKAAAVENDMALLSYWDETGMPSPVIDSARLKQHAALLAGQKKGAFFDGLVYRIRSRAGVRFLKPDTWSDGRVRKPTALLKEADAFRDSGTILQAQTLYGILAEYFIFTNEGKRALFEMAKIQAEQQEFGRRDAVKYLRRFLVLRGGGAGERCEAIYRIAFIYDQYLHERELARVNYQWIVDNAPECTFAGDAEVMLRHLGEPLPDAGVLREEAKRR